MTSSFPTSSEYGLPSPQARHKGTAGQLWPSIATMNRSKITISETCLKKLHPCGFPPPPPFRNLLNLRQRLLERKKGEIITCNKGEKHGPIDLPNWSKGNGHGAKHMSSKISMCNTRWASFYRARLIIAQTSKSLNQLKEIFMRILSFAYRSKFHREFHKSTVNIIPICYTTDTKIDQDRNTYKNTE